MENRPDNTFPLTEDEILLHFPRVFNNEFNNRAIVGSAWNIHHDKTHMTYFGNSYTKGYSTAVELLDKNGEIDVVWFWKFIKNGRYQFGYSFKKRENVESNS